MPHLIWSEASLRDLRRLHDFLAERGDGVATRPIRTIRDGVEVLRKHPGVGRPVEDLPPDIRELVVAFGQSAYVVRYRIEVKQVLIAGIRHGREAGHRGGSVA